MIIECSEKISYFLIIDFINIYLSIYLYIHLSINFRFLKMKKNEVYAAICIF